MWQHVSPPVGGWNILATQWGSTDFSGLLLTLFMFLDRLVTCSDLQFAFPQNEGTEQMVLNFFQRYNPDYITI